MEDFNPPYMEQPKPAEKSVQNQDSETKEEDIDEPN